MSNEILLHGAWGQVISVQIRIQLPFHLQHYDQSKTIGIGIGLESALKAISSIAKITSQVTVIKSNKTTRATKFS